MKTRTAELTRTFRLGVVAMTLACAACGDDAPDIPGVTPEAPKGEVTFEITPLQ